MGQQLRQRRGLPHRHREIRTLAPLGKPVVERPANDLDLIPERLEDAAQESLTAANRQDVDSCGKRDCGRRQRRPILAPTLERGAKHLSDGHAHEGRSGVRPIVDILREQEVLIGVLAADHADRVNVEQQARGAALRADLGVIDVGLAEAHVKGLEALGMLVKQVAQIVGRLMGSGNGEKHWSGLGRLSI